jgi:hypothetical protein
MPFSTQAAATRSVPRIDGGHVHQHRARVDIGEHAIRTQHNSLDMGCRWQHRDDDISAA